jgi:hypothetical protein
MFTLSFSRIFFFRSLFYSFVFFFSVSTLNCHLKIYAQPSQHLSTCKFFRANFCVCLIIFYVCALYTVPFILYFISLLIFEEQRKLWSFSLCSFIYLRVLPLSRIQFTAN